MDLGLITLRVLHIVSGVFWVGGVFFFTLILEPRLRALGPTIQRPAMQSITPVMGPAFENPESGYRETGTARFVGELMDKLGLPHRDGLALTGIKSWVNAGAPPAPPSR